MQKRGNIVGMVGKMLGDILIFVCLWIEKKVKQSCIRRQYGEKCFEKSLFLNQYTDDDFPFSVQPKSSW